MIDRYNNVEISSIFDDEYKYWIWFCIEREHLRVLGHIDKDHELYDETVDTWAASWEYNSGRINMLENKTKHDVAAFVDWMCEYAPDVSHYIHWGLTSSDIVDTCNAIQIRLAAHELICICVNLETDLFNAAKKYRNTLMLGRTHGQPVEITTFARKLWTWQQSVHCDRLNVVECARLIPIKLSGPIGFTDRWGDTHIRNVGYSLYNEFKLFGRDFQLEKAPTQIVHRDHYAHLLNAMAVAASNVERIVTEIRLLSRFEANELMEGFEDNQKSSSSMPHKRNPIGSENLCGLARMMRSYAQVGLENINLWHERDISHSSTERLIIPDAFNILYSMISRLNKLINGLLVNEDKMKENIKAVGYTISSHELLSALTQNGLNRTLAHKFVQDTMGLPGYLVDKTINESPIVPNAVKDNLDKILNPLYSIRASGDGMPQELQIDALNTCVS